MAGTNHSQLWMGSLEPYMTESFIMNTFNRMGEKPSNVKIVRNKYTGEPGGYCFVHFHSDDEAINALHKLNGKIIPNTNPAVRFRLNKAVSVVSRVSAPQREFSICVENLSADVDDYNLYKTFASRYESIRTAKVVLDSSGFSKGYGFVRFANDDEAKHCMAHMNGFKGLGSQPLNLILIKTVPRSHRQPTNSTQMAGGGYSSSQDYSWQSYSPWRVYYEDPTAALLQSIELLTQQEKALSAVANKEDELELIDHNANVEIDGLNREIMEKDYNFWDALESSKWLPFGGVESPC